MLTMIKNHKLLLKQEFVSPNKVYYYYYGEGPGACFPKKFKLVRLVRAQQAPSM